MLLFDPSTQLLVVVLVSVPLPTAKDSLPCRLLIVAWDECAQAFARGRRALSGSKIESSSLPARRGRVYSASAKVGAVQGRHILGWQRIAQA
jgi:hypothetical protein